MPAMKGISHSHSRPPRRPALSVGASSHSARRMTAHRRLCCSRATRTSTRTNCQISPAVSAKINGTVNR